jgi:TolA-binding protein
VEVAALKAWFGQEKELTVTRQRIEALAKDTKEALTAERGAKASTILPCANKVEVDVALALARAAMKLGEVGESNEWNLLALGLAEYRSGSYAAADQTLRAAVNAGPSNPWVTGTSAFYRAMSLFRQEKTDEARKIAIAAAAEMNPLPKDEQNPPGGNDWGDQLIHRLAYKEAMALIQFESLPVAPGKTKAK